MKKIILRLIGISVLIPLLIIGYLLVGPEGVYTTVNRENDQTIIIKKGASLAQIGDQLMQQGLIDNKAVFYLAIIISEQRHKLRAGEFLIPEEATPLDIIKILCSGKMVVHRITFPEGTTVQAIVDCLNNTSFLTGEIESTPREGYLLPETYSYTYGDTRQSIITRMEEAMKIALETYWKDKTPDLPYRDCHEALTMASIVEKETALAMERPRVAAVFINRLKLGMKLQADPTVIYGLTLGKAKLGRSLTRKDLESDTPFNTYMIAGLPPHPIACPGKNALQAALNPLATPDLYFVADGIGGHHFSDTLTQHNVHVQNWRRLGK